MARKAIKTKCHTALIFASRRWDKMSTAARTAYKNGKFQYLEQECGQLSWNKMSKGPKSSTASWHARLERAKLALKNVNKRKAEKTVAKESRKKRTGLDEEEFDQDLGGWVLMFIVWIPLMRIAVMKVVNLVAAMRYWDTASAVLEGLGFGSAFVNTLACRTLQQIGCCKGDIAKIGTGAGRVGNDLCGTNRRSPPSVSQLLLLYRVLKPMLQWLVAGTLGASWVVLITFQLFASLLCETRKYQDATRNRRPGHEGRHEHYMAGLRKFARAVAILLDDRPVSAKQPVIEYPEWANLEAISEVLDLFNALLLRFSFRILERPVRALRPGGAKIFHSKPFGQTRLCQWAPQLDRGSLVCFNSMATQLGQDAPGWAVSFDPCKLSTIQWVDLLTTVAFGTTVLAEGMAHDRALESGELASGMSGHTLRLALKKAEPIVYPYGRALNRLGKVNPFLSGGWESAHDGQ